jgi:hypothetical protein
MDPKRDKVELKKRSVAAGVMTAVWTGRKSALTLPLKPTSRQLDQRGLTTAATPLGVAADVSRR